MGRFLHRILVALIAVSLCGWSLPVAAQAADEPAVKAKPKKHLSRRERRARRQRLSRELARQGEAELRKSVRVFQQKHLVKAGRLELLVGGAMGIGDSLVQNYNADVGLLFHVSDRLAVGISGSKVFAQKTEHFESIQRNFGLFPERSFVQGSGFVEAQYSPVFGKFASFGLAVLQLDGYLVAAVGGLRTTTTVDYKPAFQFGGGFRIHMLRAVTLSFELRDMVFVESFLPAKAGGDPSQNVMQHVLAGVKLGFWIPPSFSYKYQR